MKQWHCYISGQKYGPVDEEVLRDWIRQGRIGPSDNVWTEGMEQWATAASVLPDMFPDIESGGSALSMVPAVPTPGTGGRTENYQLTAQAREQLRGRWGLAIGFTLLLMLINSAASSIPAIGSVASLILAGPLQLGSVIFFLTFIRRGDAKIDMLFAGFKNFGNALGTYILTVIFVFLWMLLLIVPGFIAALAYSQAMYLIADDHTLGPLDAIRKSKQMMEGFKWKLFCLGWRFFGWALLCILTLGIGLIWLIPYMSVSHARFYEDLRSSGTIADSS